MATIPTHWLILTFGLLGNVVSFMVFLAPLPTFYTIHKKKSTQGFQCIPYVVALFSAMLWLYYASLKANTTLLVTINSFGCFIETIYISFFLYYAHKKARIQTMKMLVLLVVAGFGLIVALTHFLVKEMITRAQIVGWICLIFSLCVFVAPLGILRQVIRTKSVEYMPFLLSLFLTLSAVMWFFYGLFLKDYNIWVPNVLGFTFGIIQMVLYVIYKDKKNTNDQQKLPTDQVPNHVFILDQAEKLPEQIIDIVKLGGLNNKPTEKSPVASLHQQYGGPPRPLVQASA
ncbi:hypothetical protein Leryth_021427 [Lithospermum erythrorhizon]|uniref:Bidirectional sugar transporter SWEET n=1 Tax=Lithospermum erythrorhizon TaxID=34254 RepID=A0AAV3RWK5_LITER|nr:hypothetical protein Leryth_021427 [Lithospermum erythrorhizon]